MLGAGVSVRRSLDPFVTKSGLERYASSGLFRATERHRNARIKRSPNRGSSDAYHLRMDAHRLEDPFHFRGFDANSPLALRPPLKVANRDQLTADPEQPVVRLAEPIVERRHGDPETSGGLAGSEQFFGHVTDTRSETRLPEEPRGSDPSRERAPSLRVSPHRLLADSHGCRTVRIPSEPRKNNRLLFGTRGPDC